MTVSTTTPPKGETTPPPQPLAPHLWHAGSLVYTKASLRMLFFWLLWGDFTLMLRERSVGPTFQAMLKQLHASDFVLGLLIGFIPQAVSMVLGPVISYRSDRHRGPRGRRIPFLLIPTPLCFLGMVGLAFSPKIGAWAHPALSQMWGMVSSTPMTLTGSILTTVAVFWTLFEICAIATAVIFNSLIADVVPRGVIGRFFGLFRVVSLADGIFFNLVLIKYAEKHYALIFCAVGALFAASFLLMCFMVKEGEHPPPDTSADGKPRSFIAAMRIYLRECFSHRYYRWLTTSIALSMMAFVPVNTFSIFFAYSVKMPLQIYGRYSAAQLFLSLLIAYPIGWLADRFHPLRLILLSFVLHGTTVTLAFFLVRDSTTFGIFHILTGACAGFWLTAYQPSLPLLLPRGKYATIVSGIGLAGAIGTMIVAPACGWFLDHVVAHDYRYIYLWTLVFDVAALVTTLVVYRQFKSFGGATSYVAPEV